MSARCWRCAKRWTTACVDAVARHVSRCLALSLVVSWLRLSLRVRGPAQEEGSSGMHTYHYKVVDSADAMKKDDWHRVVAVARPAPHPRAQLSTTLPKISVACSV